jgi:two-component system chemotaxis sensor kinase CheA
MDTQREAYKIEANELLAELETSLLELEQSPDDTALVDRVFRAMHTIKGSGAMFGFDDIAAFTHDVETVFDRVRDGRIPVTTHLVNLALLARDHIKGLLDDGAEAQANDPENGAGILAGFRALLIPDDASMPDETDPLSNPAPAAPASPTPVREQMFRIQFTPYADLFRNGTNPLALIDELAGLGPCRVIGYTDRLPEPALFDPESCYLH